MAHYLLGSNKTFYHVNLLCIIIVTELQFI